MKTFYNILQHLLPLSLGVGSVILCYNNITGWGWFLFISFTLGIILSTSDENENTKKEE